MQLFGYEFKKKGGDKDDNLGPNRIPMEEVDGSTVTTSGSNTAEVFSLDATWKNEKDLIQYYRDMSLNHNVDRAIEEIVTDAIVIENGKQPVSIDFEDGTEISDSIQKRIEEEFYNIMQLLDFKHEGSRMFREFYIDGRLAYFKVVDPRNLKKGIQDLQRLDVINLKKFKNIQTKKDSKGNEFVTRTKEFYTYSANLTSPYVQYQLIKKEIHINAEAISYVTSGLIDKKKNWVLSYLHKAIRPYNHLRLLEDASLIYQIARAPERRLFYVDVGNLPRNRAEQYLSDIMSKYRNKITYDATSGDIKDSKREMSMLEDIWLPRREGSKGTEVSTLGGSMNMSTETLEFFKGNIYDSLNVPKSRLESGTGFSIGRASEISRDEVKFASFINSVRNRFSFLFYDLLRTQLILKGIIAEKEWIDIQYDIQFVFESNVLFAELKHAEIISQRIENLNSIERYVGEYFSKRWVQKNILFLTDSEIEDLDKEIDEEIKSGVISKNGDDDF